MTSTVRRFLAVLLLVCLPLQVFAGINTVSCADRMPDCPGMHMSGTSCCDHSQHPMGGAMDQGATQGDHASQDMSPCAGANSCAPVATMAALPVQTAFAVPTTKEIWDIPDPPAYFSYIGDGLHRPPSSLA